jgi:hypothetical protein
MLRFVDMRPVEWTIAMQFFVRKQKRTSTCHGTVIASLLFDVPLHRFSSDLVRKKKNVLQQCYDFSEKRFMNERSEVFLRNISTSQ